MNWFKKKEPAEQRFWAWFQKNEDKLFTQDPPAAVWMKELPRELKRVHPDLVWQASMGHKDTREFIISADGIVAAFSAVESLADAAPPLPRWTIIRFRPREPGYADMSLQLQTDDGESIEVAADKLECVLEPQVDQKGLTRISIELFIPGCPSEDSNPHKHAAFLLLDAALGEYDMECKVGYIGVYPFQRKAEGRIAFAKLREAFDRLVEQTLAGG